MQGYHHDDNYYYDLTPVTSINAINHGNNAPDNILNNNVPGIANVCKNRYKEQKPTNTTE